MNPDDIEQAIKNIGINIKKLRELKGYTREVMADELNLSVSGYGKIERGEVEFSVKKVYEIAHILNTDILKILNFDTSGIFNDNNNSLTKFSENISKDRDYNSEKNQTIYLKILEDKLDKLEIKIKVLESLYGSKAEMKI
jgi:transcriptional regulator with XRE-family HTH domain